MSPSGEPLAVILNESDATPMDLRFRLFGTDVRVHPFFWLFSAIIGWNVTEMRVLSDNGIPELAIWVGCVFFSILLHEFGHIWMGRIFGSNGHIVLQAMGGLAVGSNALSRSGHRILVCAAGPAIQLVLAGILLLGATLGTMLGVFVDAPKWVYLVINFLFSINFYWALINLLPVFPLDGGQISRELCCQASPAKGLLASLWISFGLSAVLALNALAGSYGKPFIPPIIPGLFSAPTGMWAAFLFGMFAVGSWQGIVAEQQSRRVYEDDDLPWER